MTDIPWSFYDLATGVFSGVGFCGTAAEVASQLADKGEGVGAHEGAVDYLTQKLAIDTGLLVAHTPPGPTLAACKAARWEAVKAAADVARAAPLLTDCGSFNAGEKSRSALMSKLQAMQLTAAATTTWTLADNTHATLTLAQLVDVVVALDVRTQAIQDATQSQRDAIDRADSVDALAATGPPTTAS